MTIALTSATGKLGRAVLNAIIDNKLVDTKELIVCTSTNPVDSCFDDLRLQHVILRQANFDDPSSLKQAYSGSDKLFLVSTPRIEMDYNDAPLWQGREKHHRAAIDAALEVGVKHIYYTSLGFGNPSKAGVMRAHIRTEAYLHGLEKNGRVRITIIREGLYNESWPLYFGYYFGLKEETRKEIVVAGDGPISWTAISDMAFGTAKILSAASEEWAGKTFYLSQRKTWMLQDIAGFVGKVKGEQIRLRIASRKDYEDFYIGRGMEKASVEWWSSSYDALKDEECAIDDSTLEKLLKEAGRSPEPLEATIEKMLK